MLTGASAYHSPPAPSSELVRQCTTRRVRVKTKVEENHDHNGRKRNGQLSWVFEKTTYSVNFRKIPVV